MTIAITHSQFIVTVYYLLITSVQTIDLRNHLTGHGAAVQNFSIIYLQLLIIHSY
jgi:hypothetical protein